MKMNLLNFHANTIATCIMYKIYPLLVVFKIRRDSVCLAQAVKLIFVVCLPGMSTVDVLKAYNYNIKASLVVESPVSLHVYMYCVCGV